MEIEVFLLTEIRVLTFNYVDPRFPKIIDCCRHPARHLTVNRERVLFEAFQVNICRGKKNFEKGNLV